MASSSRSFATDHMPERVHVTQDLERRFKEQEERKAAAKTDSSSQSEKATAAQRST